jgi:hypothetical protein
VDRLGKLFAHQIEPAGQFLIVRERTFDALGVAAAQRSGCMPRQEILDLVAVASLFAHRVHGQPLSTPAALSSSANFFRA